MMKEYMTSYNRKVKECKEVVNKYKEVVWLAEKCAKAIMENFCEYFFGETETLCIEEIKLDFASLAHEEYGVNLEQFNSIVNAVDFLSKEGMEYC